MKLNFFSLFLETIEQSVCRLRSPLCQLQCRWWNARCGDEEWRVPHPPLQLNEGVGKEKRPEHRHTRYQVGQRGNGQKYDKYTFHRSIYSPSVLERDESTCQEKGNGTINKISGKGGGVPTYCCMSAGSVQTENCWQSVRWKRPLIFTMSVEDQVWTVWFTAATFQRSSYSLTSLLTADMYRYTHTLLTVDIYTHAADIRYIQVYTHCRQLTYTGIHTLPTVDIHR